MLAIKRENSGYMLNLSLVGEVRAVIDTGAVVTVLSLERFCWLTGRSERHVLTDAQRRPSFKFKSLSGNLTTVPHVLRGCTVCGVKLNYFPCFVRIDPNNKTCVLGRDFIYACNIFGKDVNWKENGIDKQALCIGEIDERDLLNEFVEYIKARQASDAPVLTVDKVLAYFTDPTDNASNWEKYCKKYDLNGSVRESEKQRLYSVTGAQSEQEFEDALVNLL